MDNQINLAELSTADLKRLQTVAAETIESRRADEQATAMNQIKELVETYDINLDQLMGFLNPQPKKAGRPRKDGSAAPKATASKSPPKYRDPTSGATWTGKGRKPEWIKAAADPEAFLIPEGERTAAPTQAPTAQPKAPKTPKATAPVEAATPEVAPAPEAAQEPAPEAAASE